jgi:hypothetical protein
MESAKLVSSQILKQTYEVTNNFDDKACIIAMQSILSDKIFKELINGEKHSLTVTFAIAVNEEEKQPDPDKAKAELIDLLKEITNMSKEDVSKGSNSLLWFKASQIQHRHNLY